MGLFDSLFGKKKPLSEEELMIKTDDLFTQAEQFISSDNNRKAHAVIVKKYPDVIPMIDIGCPQFQKFAELILQLKYAEMKKLEPTSSEIFFSNLPSFSVFKANQNTITSEFLNAASSVKEELIFVKFTDTKGYIESDPVFFIEGLAEFYFEPNTVIMFLGPDPDNFLIKVKFLNFIASEINRDIKLKKLPARFEELLNGRSGYHFIEGDCCTTLMYPVFKFNSDNIF